MIAAAVSRRHFLKITTIAGGGMMLGFNLLSQAENIEHNDLEAVFAPNAYITINHKGLVTLMAPNPEIGQGVKTALPMILAEELNVKWDSVYVEMAPLDKKYGSQVAGGSGAIRSRFMPIRQAGATARVMLISAAAGQWAVPEGECYAEDGFVVHKPSGKKLGYGELAAKAATLPVPTDVKLKDPKDFKIIGTRVHNIDNKKIITGQPLYGMDTRREGMLFAMVSRPPAFGKTLKSFDDTETRKVTGVKNVVQAHGVVAVLATSTWAAKKGRDVLKVIWEDTGKLESSTDHDIAFKDMIAQKSEAPSRNDGDVEAILGSGAKVVEAIYECPALSHAPMEPINFFADVRDGKAELYGPTQVPANMCAEVAKALNIPEANVTLGMPRQGGGFGRKLRPDNGVEAALISAAAKCPVQMFWTREDDIQGDFYRAPAMYKYKAVIGADNTISAWHVTSAALNGRASVPDGFPAAAITHFRHDNHSVKTDIQMGPWRAPTSNVAAFADETFLDELAHEMKKDPIALRLELLDKAKNSPVGTVKYNIEKFKSVINLVSQMSNWGKNTKPNVYYGFASYFSFNSYAAHVAEVTKTKDGLRVTKVFSAINCGRVVNLSGAENQVEGAIIDGLSHALFSKITFDQGAVMQKNFHTYKFLRMKDAPLEVIVKFVPSEDAPTGLGEPGLPPIAPAVGNAIFAATGKRYRKLPFELGKV
ncbi:xanthine dehydrogenase family protein molybdopterin-binding subunit [Mucilaginibacter paludis]|uniref:Aldehyde oxidase and xanthine dehydrogenase molybdopterin binding n=1 Tax=Mucilaginibacter paludis DSM 18603 TaxID=714943 RepID=H1Y0D9_9SPHI|nr:molybdopterin cofactor-binding domain-containing protein [Mucilaginibacter paludis]EHQ28188.1 aldehyde oxidase and xanthine dehydrogenase molybdopterin binding [Mucilaginibacter paludis DSM 18603]